MVGIGNGTLQLIDENSVKNDFLLTEILYASKINGNVLSIGKLILTVTVKLCLDRIVAISSWKTNIQLLLSELIICMSCKFLIKWIQLVIILVTIKNVWDPVEIQKMATNYLVEGIQKIKSGIKELC